MMALIRSLPAEFANFHSSLLLVPGSLDFKKVKDAFLQEERNRLLKLVLEVEALALTESNTVRARGLC